MKQETMTPNSKLMAVLHLLFVAIMATAFVPPHHPITRQRLKMPILPKSPLVLKQIGEIALDAPDSSDETLVTKELDTEFVSANVNEHLNESLKNMLETPVGQAERDEASSFPALKEQDDKLMENVGAILAASEEAMAVAEASLTEDIVEKLELPSAEKTERDEESSSSALKEQDDKLMVENVGAILAASEEAMAVAEASLTEDIGEKLELASANVQQDATEPLQPQSSVNELTEEAVKTSNITAPSVGKILKFAIPAIGVWLCGPLLSLIDTSSVGLLSGTTQQAALNPAVAVTDYAALLIAFLYTGTTNLIAAAREADHSVEGSPRTTKTFVGALQLSTFVGGALGACLFFGARHLLRAIIGNDGISPAVFDAAMKYVRIRALGMPAAAVIGSAQAACLGMQDIRSPLYVIAAAAVVNFFGDMMFVGSSHPLIGGTAGAAWATVFSQYAAVVFFMNWLCKKPNKSKQEEPPKVNLSKAILELTGKPSSAGAGRRRRFRDSLKSFQFSVSQSKSSDKEKSVSGGGRFASLIRPLKPKSKQSRPKAAPKEKGFSARGFLEGKFRGRHLVKVPSKETVDEFSPYVLPVSATQAGRVSGYVAMSHVVSSSLGTISMAAQQVIVSLFYCLCPIADSLSLTAQSFVPTISEKQASQERSKALRETVTNFVKAGAVFGSVMVAAVSCIPLLSGFFTTDASVIALVNMVVPLLLGVFSVHGIVCSTEGLLLGQKDLSFLGKMYAAYFAVVPLLMLRVKRAALSGVQGVNLISVWKVFLGYQLFRFGAWGARVAMLQRRTERAVEEN